MPVLKTLLINKWRSARLALVIGLSLRAGLAVAQNLVTNPGFETGSISPWVAFGGSITLSVETSVVHSGTYAAEVSGRSQTFEGISQPVQSFVTAGQVYNVSAWVRLVSGSPQNIQMTVQVNSGSSYVAINSNSVSSTGWTQLSGQFTGPSGASSLIFYVEVPTSSNASYYIDDVSWTNAPTPPNTNAPLYASSLVDWNNVHQRIDGFGASSAWNSTWTTSEADVLFSTNNNISYLGGTYNGAGLSLLRNHIAYANTTSSNDLPTTVETSIMQMAQERGARVWSTPWTPAAGFKTPDDTYDSSEITNPIDGGSYLGSGDNITNLNYASQLANYVASMKNTYGVTLYALSIQNEPDADVTSYEACQWTGTQFHDFVTNLYAALAAQGLSSTKIILPESESWSDPHGLAATVMSDPNVAADVGIVADHNYVADNSVGDQTVPVAMPSYGKALWETEVALLGTGSDPSIENAIYWAGRIHLFMTQANANAYHYWWLEASGNEALLDSTLGPAKRLFAFGQFSRFVRPDFYRIDATSSQQSALISAYKDSASPAFAIVAINTNAATNIIATITLTNFTATTVTPWMTSVSNSLVPLAPVTLTNGTFTYTLPEMSVVTFVGQESAAPAAPTIGSVANQTVNPGVTLLITNTASASDVPPNKLTFGAANTLPGAATINPTTGVFSWRPHVSQADTTNVIEVMVTDSGGGLSATNSFNVVVNPISRPAVSSITSTGTKVDLMVTGPTGPDYTLLTSTNLVNWQTDLMVSSPTPPVMLVDTNYPNGPARFYRVQVGP